MVSSVSPVKALFQHEPRERGRVARRLWCTARGPGGAAEISRVEENIQRRPALHLGARNGGDPVSAASPLSVRCGRARREGHAQGAGFGAGSARAFAPKCVKS